MIFHLHQKCVQFYNNNLVRKVNNYTLKNDIRT